jgi:hypothetical protein
MTDQAQRPEEPRIPTNEEAAILLDLQTPFWRNFMADADWGDHD